MFVPISYILLICETALFFLSQILSWIGCGYNKFTQSEIIFILCI